MKTENKAENKDKKGEEMVEIKRKVEECDSEFNNHIDIKILEMLANNQHGKLSSIALEMVLTHLSRCQICSSQLDDLENARKG